MTETRAMARARKREEKERETDTIPAVAAKPKRRDAGNRRADATKAEMSRLSAETRERREAEDAKTLREATMVRAQRDAAVAGLEVLAAACPGDESPIERAQRLLAEATLTRVHQLTGARRSHHALAVPEEANADG